MGFDIERIHKIATKKKQTPKHVSGLAASNMEPPLMIYENYQKINPEISGKFA